ncbi:hypothetical protein [Paenibacillus xylanexedens]|nr:hypothetical protein [Paenibacillus xylanexedens]
MEVTLKRSGEFVKWLYELGGEGEVLEGGELGKEIGNELNEWLEVYDREG